MAYNTLEALVRMLSYRRLSPYFYCTVIPPGDVVLW